MWQQKTVDIRLMIIWLLIAAEISMGLRNVIINVPSAVRRGDNVTLFCNYDMENDTLYSVKWYKGKREFFRYVPKDPSPVKIFLSAGLIVEKSQSNQSQVTLLSVALNVSGKFSCEVSADAPSFHTQVVSGEMEIIELPAFEPTFTGVHTRYRMSDILRGNCSSDYSKPAANLTWIVNDVPAIPVWTRKYKNIRDVATNLESSILGLTLVIQPQHFIRGKLKVKCMAQIYNLYYHQIERTIEEDRPRILATGTSGHNMNLFQSSPYDQPPNGIDGEMSSDQDDLYLKPYKADLSSNTIKTTIFSIKIIIILNLIIFVLDKFLLLDLTPSS